MTCLLDRPDTNQLGDVSTRKQPGEDFTEDRQCELVYGRGSKICSYMVSGQEVPSTRIDLTYITSNSKDY